MSYYTPPPYYYPTSLGQTAQPTTQTTPAYAAGSQAPSVFPSLTKTSLESIIQHSGSQLLPEGPPSEPSTASSASASTTVDTPSTATAPPPSVEPSSLPPPALYARNHNPPTAPATPATPATAMPSHHHRHSLPGSSFTFSYPYAPAAPRLPASHTTPSLASILDEPQPPQVKSPTLLHRSHSATASRRRFYRPSPQLHPTPADQDSAIVAMKKQGKPWPEIAHAAKMDVDAARQRYTQLVTPQPYYEPRSARDEPEEVLWDKDDVETLRDLLEIGERAKWKFISAELTKDRNKRITSIACQKKFKDMFGVAESSSVLGSSLCYVVSPSGWSSLDAVPRRQYTPQQQQQQQQQPPQHASSSKKPMPQLTP